MAYQHRDPRSKEELVDKLMHTDLHSLGAERPIFTRTAANRVEVEFPASGRKFELSAHIPRRGDEGKSFAAGQDEVWSVPPDVPEQEPVGGKRKGRKPASIVSEGVPRG